MAWLGYVLGIAGIVSLTACSGQPRDHGGGGGSSRIPCNGNGACQVAVVVDASCHITPPEDVEVTARNVHILWKLDAPNDIVFADDGIAGKPDSPDWSDQFVDGSLQGNRRVFQYRDKNDKAGPGQSLTYHYSIHVVHANGSECAKLDPTIVNKG